MADRHVQCDNCSGAVVSPWSAKESYCEDCKKHQIFCCWTCREKRSCGCRQ